MTTKHLHRVKRHIKSRHTIQGTAACPRVSVYRGTRHLYVQIIDDSTGRTIVGMSDTKVPQGTGLERAQALGKELAKLAKENKITSVVFDRGGFQYHGQVKALAEAMRAEGLKF
jgi:large subunit ribosomal protein L18